MKGHLNGGDRSCWHVHRIVPIQETWKVEGIRTIKGVNENSDVLYVIEGSGANSLYIVAMNTRRFTSTVEETMKVGRDALVRNAMSLSPKQG